MIVFQTISHEFESRIPHPAPWVRGRFLKSLAFLEKYGLISENSLCGDSLKVKCFFHHERTPSLAFNMSTDRYYCFGCGAFGNLVDAIQYVEGCDYLKALRIHSRLEDIEYNVDKYVYTEEEDDLYSVEVSNKFLKNLEPPTGEVLSYLGSRKISDRLIEKFNILEDRRSEHCLILPIIIGGIVKGVCKRVINDTKPKYLYNKGFRKKQGCFLLVENPELPVFLTEGLLDAYSAYEMGYPNVACIFGGIPSKKQIFQLSKYDIICATDPNEVGERGYDALKNKIEGKLLRFDFDEFEDTNDMLVNNKRIFVSNIHELIRR